GYSIQFVYENGNLDKKILNEEGSVSYTYDTKKNPFDNEAFLNLGEVIMYLHVVGGFEFLFLDEHGVFMNSNNLIALEVKNYTLGGIEDRSFQYEYDKTDYPIKKSIGNGTISVEYNYSSN
ncbi:MAG: hypothetical protein WA913_00120, partial [Pricia sp.]